MWSSKRRTVLLFVGLFCFAVSVNVAAFWSQELLEMVAGPGGDPVEEAGERVTGGERVAPGGDDERSDGATGERSEPAGPAGPAPPFDEHFRDPDGDAGPLAPAYRDLPENGGSIRTAGEDGEQTYPPHETEYEVHIDGDLAAVTVEQMFYNPTDSTLDAVYQFPLNRRAAVYGMRMDVGDRTVRAEIKEKERARKIYEKARDEGNNAALLSQQRPNWFTQRVANIGPDEAIEVTLQYVHPLPKEDGTYQFVIPTQIGERFGSGASADNDLVPGDGSSESVPTTSAAVSDAAKSAGRTDMSVEVHIDGSLPVRRLRSPSHRIRMREYSPSEWWVDVADDRGLAHENFRLEFELADDQTSAGVHTYWDEAAEKGYFSLLVEPPRRPDPAEVSNREVVFVLDTSGSMNGDPLDTSKAFVKHALRQLRRARDSFRIVQFDNTASEYSEAPIRTDDANVREAISYVENLASGGGTEYGPGLRRALGPETPEGSVRLVVFLTDGYIGYEFEVLGKLRELIGDARLFGIGIGGSPNRYLLEEMGRMGSGFAAFLQSDDSADAPVSLDEKIDRTVRRIESPVMTHIRVDWGDLKARQISPRPVPDLYAGDSIRIHGTYSNPGTHEITVHGTVGPERVSIPVDVEAPAEEQEGRAVELTWARQQIRENMHDLLGAKANNDPETPAETYRERIVDLGLEYSLTTQWTSFVAVSESGPLPSTGSGGDRAVRSAGRHKTIGATGIGRAGATAGSGGRGLSGSSTGSGGGSASLGNKTVPSKPSVVPQKPEVHGSLSKEIIRNNIKRYRPKVKACYERRLQSEPDLSGEVTVRLTIESSGDVQTVEIADATIDDDKLQDCMKRRLRRLTFPSYAGDGVIEVNYPYTFTSSD